MRPIFARIIAGTAVLVWLSTSGAAPLAGGGPTGAGPTDDAPSCCCAAEVCGCCEPSPTEPTAPTTVVAHRLAAQPCLCAAPSGPVPVPTPSSEISSHSAAEAVSTEAEVEDRTPTRTLARSDEASLPHGGPPPPPPGRAPPAI